MGDTTKNYGDINGVFIFSWDTIGYIFKNRHRTSSHFLGHNLGHQLRLRGNMMTINRFGVPSGNLT